MEDGLSSDSQMEDSSSESKSDHVHPDDACETKEPGSELSKKAPSTAEEPDHVLQSPKEDPDSKANDRSGKTDTPPDAEPGKAESRERESQEANLLGNDVGEDAHNPSEATRGEARYRVRSNYRCSKCGQLKKGHSCPEDLLGSHASMRPRAEQHAESTRSLLLARLKARCDDDPVRGAYGATFRRGGYAWRHDPNHRALSERIPARWAPHPYMHSQNLFAASAYHRQKAYGGEMLEYSGAEMVRAYPSMVAPQPPMPFKRDPMLAPDAPNWPQRPQEASEEPSAEGAGEDGHTRSAHANTKDAQPQVLPLLSNVQDAPQPEGQEAHQMMRRVPTGERPPGYNHNSHQIGLAVQGHKGWTAAESTSSGQSDDRPDAEQDGQHQLEPEPDFDHRKADGSPEQPTVAAAFSSTPDSQQPDSFSAYPESTPVSDAMTGWHERVNW